jgi:hypothetical protein
MSPDLLFARRRCNLLRRKNRMSGTSSEHINARAIIALLSAQAVLNDSGFRG